MNQPNRTATITRETKETRIQLELALDGGPVQIQTGIGFFDHMLELWARHAGFRLQVSCDGDLHVDQHHSVEDVGICLGQALRAAVGEKRGIVRYGSMVLPMDDALVTAAVDLSGRPYLAFHVEIPSARIGTFDSELIEEFWRAFTTHTGCNLHVLLHHGRNSHHIAEAVFKAIGRVFGMAVAIDERRKDEIPSTKGTL